MDTSTIISIAIGGVTIPLIAYIWYENRREVRELREWKKNMNGKGGPLVRTDHDLICEKVGDQFCDKLDERFRTHEKLVDEKLKSAVSDLKLYLFMGFKSGKFQQPGD